MLIGLILLSCFSWSSPLETMNQRLEAYQKNHEAHCVPGTESSVNDNGFRGHITCAISCEHKSLRETLTGIFSPREQGLIPGNGSSEKNTVWGATGVAINAWSSELCLEKAREICAGLTMVKSAIVESVSSGKWKLNRFPGCQETASIRSPFDDTLETERLHPEVSGILSNFHDPVKRFMLPGTMKTISLGVIDPSGCRKTIKGNLCYGDCVDLKEKMNVETLATAEPLGSSDVSVCGDQLAQALKGAKLKPQVRSQICEQFYWRSVINSRTMIRSCAALRGKVNCESF
jgi:hypothetical protein